MNKTPSLADKLKSINEREAQAIISNAPLKEKGKKDAKEKGYIKISMNLPSELQEDLALLGLNRTKTIITATKKYLEDNYKEALEKMKKDH